MREKLLLLSLLLALFPATSVLADESCASAEALAIERFGTSLIVSELDLSELGAADQRLAFRFLPPDARDRAWIRHLRQELDEPARFTPRQLEVVLYAIELLEEGLHRIDRDDLLYTAKVEYGVEGLRDVASRVFDREELKKLFTSLGKSGRAGAKSAFGLCECNQVDDWCSGSTDCGPSNCTQSPTNTGCGWFWLKNCDGECF